MKARSLATIRASIKGLLGLALICSLVGISACQKDDGEHRAAAQNAFISRALVIYSEIDDFSERYSQVKYLQEIVRLEHGLADEDANSLIDFLRGWLQVAYERTERICSEDGDDCEVDFVRGAIDRAREEYITTRLSAGQVAVWQRTRVLVNRGAKIANRDMAAEWKTWADGELDFIRDTLVKEHEASQNLQAKLDRAVLLNRIFLAVVVLALLLAFLSWRIKSWRNLRLERSARQFGEENPET